MTADVTPGGGTRGTPAPGPELPAAPGAPPRAVPACVLVVEDDPALARALRINLRARGYQAVAAQNGRQGMHEATRNQPDVIILDLGLPDMDGLAVIRGLREWSRAPIIVLSGRAGSSDKIEALDAGADDYVTKPFSMEELLARLRAALRREDGGDGAVRVRIGQCEIDVPAHAAWRATADGAPESLHLTPTEWLLLEILLRNPGQLIGMDRLLTAVWGPGYQTSAHYLRFHMARLRRKLEDDPARPRHLLTEPGMGYRYQP